MSSTETGKGHAGEVARAATVETKLEVIVIPVSDVDRAKRFYGSLGWRLDADFTEGEELRVVQLTPPGSPCSIIFGKGITTAAPGSIQGLFLIVSDIEAARTEIAARGVDVSAVFHFEGLPRVSGTKGRVPGADPEGRSYRSWVSFRDPDGNGWFLQEIKTRLPGRGLSNLDVAALKEFLGEAEKLHGEYSPSAPKHHWSDWYAGYIVARENGKAPVEAVKDGALGVERGRP
jgi:catechol 2,3-dioxygenase-like lactoylglutathione lyase family enzyme